MEFRDYASKEAQEFLDRLAKAATAAAQDSAKKAADEAARAVEQVKRDLKAKTHEADELQSALKSLQAQGETFRKDLKTQRDRADAAEAHVGRIRETLGTAEAARMQAESARAQEVRARTAMEQELKEVRKALDATMAESERLSTQLDAAATEKATFEEKVNAAHSQIQAAENKRQTITTLYKAAQVRVESLEKAHAELERALGEARAEAENVRGAVMGSDALLERVLEAFETLSTGNTISELLVGLADALSAQFSRVALFSVKGNKLEGTYQVGDLNTDIAKVVIPLSMDGLLARAVSSGCIESIEAHGSSDAGRAPFGGSPTCALALPVVVSGETFGIVYADNGAQPDQKETAASQTWKGRFAELVLRHAVALLMRLTSELRTLAELREHATRLLNHVADMYASDVDAGTQGAELRSRLHENVECARRLYAQRVEIEGPAAAALLDEELARLIEKRSGSPFGRDLAEVARGASAAAEAS